MSATTTDPTLASHFTANPAAAIHAPVGFLSRQHILEATEACFVETGYDGTTIRAIAARLGCSVGSIYRYFADKNELLIACAERIFTPVLRDLEIGAPVEQSMRSYAEQVRRNDQMYRLVFFLVTHRGGVPQPVKQIIDIWTQRLDDARRARQLWSQLHGQLMLGGSDSASPVETPAAASPAAAAAATPIATTLRRAAMMAPITPVAIASEPIYEPEDVTLL